MKAVYAVSTPDNVRTALGKVLRARRLECGLSVEQVGAALDLSAQTVFSYEEATTSVSVTRLFELASIYGTEPAAILAEVSRLAGGQQPHTQPAEELAIIARFGEEIILGTRRIRDETVRKAVLDLLREITAPP
jgi:transcriptional regulator with XRE-family HTH domain